MPNRWVREAAIASERVNQLSWHAEVFWRRLLNKVDDFGRFTANAELLRSALFPLKLDRVAGADIAKLLLECERAALVSTYMARDGKQYLAMHQWEQGRAKKSKYPDPPPEVCERLLTDVYKCEHTSTNVPDPDPDPEGIKRESPKLGEVVEECRIRGYPDAEGERFWHHYEAKDWVDGAGVPIRKWRPKLTNWMVEFRANGTKRNGRTESPTANRIRLENELKELNDQLHYEHDRAANPEKVQRRKDVLAELGRLAK